MLASNKRISRVLHMSQRNWILLAGLLIVLLASVGFWDELNLFRQGETEVALVEEDQFLKNETVTPSLSAELLSEQSLSPEPLPEEYQDYISQFETGDKLRHLVKDAANLSDQEKALKMQQVQQEIDKLKQAEKLSQVEYLMLQLALLKLSPDSEKAKQQSVQLIEQYRQIAAERQQEFINNPDPQFKDYKLREKAIVAEIMSMQVFPDGLTKEEYLARRLAEAREAAYQ